MELETAETEFLLDSTVESQRRQRGGGFASSRHAIVAIVMAVPVALTFGWVLGAIGIIGPWVNLLGWLVGLIYLRDSRDTADAVATGLALIAGLLAILLVAAIAVWWTRSRAPTFLGPAADAPMRAKQRWVAVVGAVAAVLTALSGYVSARSARVAPPDHSRDSRT